MVSMKKTILSASAVIVVIAGVSCTKVISKISEDDPCTRAFVARKNASNTRDQAEKEQLLRDAEVYDQQCHARNATNPGTPKRY